MNRGNFITFAGITLALLSVTTFAFADELTVGWGDNTIGQIDAPENLPVLTALESGYSHTLGLSESGTVYAWGSDSSGQVSVPTGLEPVIAVSAGYTHSLALTQSGEVVGWGDDTFGQISAHLELTSAVAISAGGGHSLALTEEGEVLGWGLNTFGQASVPGEMGEVATIAAAGFHSLALLSDGTVAAWGWNSDGQTNVPGGLTNVTAIATGFNHNLVLRTDGTIVAWGSNEYGQCDVPEGLNNVRAIAAGFSQSIALKSDGTVIAWGSNMSGEMGIDQAANAVSLIAAGNGFSIAQAMGPIVIRHPEDRPIVPGQEVTLSIQALSSESLQYQWEHDGVPIEGANSSELTIADPQVADGGEYRVRVSETNGEVLTQPAILTYPPAIVSQTERRDVYWGTPVEFDIQITGTDPLAFQWFYYKSNIEQATAIYGQTNSVLRIESPEWEDNGFYFATVSNAADEVQSVPAELRVYNLADPDIQPPNSPVVSYDGDLHLRILQGGISPDRFQWQLNGEDIPGQEAGEFSNLKPSDSGEYRYASITPAGRIYSDPVDIFVKHQNPVNYEGRKVTLDVGTGRGLVESFQWYHGDDLIVGATNSTYSIPSLDLSDTGEYFCVLLQGGMLRTVKAAQLTVLPKPAAGRLISWGTYTHPESGLPEELNNTIRISASTQSDVYTALTADGRVHGWGSRSDSFNSQSSSLQDVISVASGGSGRILLHSNGTLSAHTEIYWEGSFLPSILNAVDVAIGDDYGLALLNDSTVVSWGDGPVAPAGLTNVVAIASGNAHHLALKANGSLAAWGDNFWGQATIPGGLKPVQAIACGAGHNLVLFTDGTVASWGENLGGQNNIPSGLNDVVAIGAGYRHNYAIRSDGSLVKWGAEGTNDPVIETPVTATNLLQIDVAVRGALAIAEDSNTPVILMHPEDLTREHGESAEFAVEVLDAEQMTFQWKFNGVDLAGETSQVLSLNSVTIDNDGDYSAVITSPLGGMIESLPARLSAIPLPIHSLDELIPGRVVGWGRKFYGEAEIPEGLTNVVVIASGSSSITSYAIKQDASLVQWDGIIPEVLVGADVIAVDGGQNHAAAVFSNGTLLVWGNNDYGGNQEVSEIRNIKQIASFSDFNMALDINGDLITWGGSSPLFEETQTGIISIAAGRQHGLVLKEDGTVLQDAYSATEATPVPEGLSNVTAIAAGLEHSLALLEDGTVVGWGLNDLGQAMPPDGLTDVIAIAAAGYHSLALRNDHTVVAWGSSEYGMNDIPVGLTNIVAIAAGWQHNLAIQAGPLVVAPPEDFVVELGSTVTFAPDIQAPNPISYQWLFNGAELDGEIQSSLTLENVQADQEGEYTVIAESDGFYASTSGTLTLGTVPSITTEPSGLEMVRGDSGLIQVIASGTTPLRYQWFRDGEPFTGQTSNRLQIASATAEIAGTYYVQVSNSLGTVLSETVDLIVHVPATILTPFSTTDVYEGTEVVFSVDAMGDPPLSFQWFLDDNAIDGENSKMLSLENAALSDSGEYSIEVSNQYGVDRKVIAELMVTSGIPLIISQPKDLISFYGRDAEFSVTATGITPTSYQWFQDGNELAGETNSLLTLHNLGTEQTGEYSVLLNNSAGTTQSNPVTLTLDFPPNVFAWGSNDFSQLDVPSTLTNAVAIAAGYYHSLAITSDGTVTGWGRNDSGQLDVPEGLTDVVDIAAGQYHSLALKADGTVVAWGNVGGSPHGQTEIPNGLSNVTAIAAGALNSFVVKNDGTVVGWGYDAYGQSTPPEGLNGVVDVAAGFEHSIALRVDGTVVGWGYNYGDPEGLDSVTAITAASLNFLALRTNGRVVGWGTGNRGAINYTGPVGVRSIGAGGSNVTISSGGNTTVLRPHYVAGLTDGTVSVWGDQAGSLFAPPTWLKHVDSVDGGFFHNLALTLAPLFISHPYDQVVHEGESVIFSAEVVSRFDEPVQLQWFKDGIPLPEQNLETLRIDNVSLLDEGRYSLRATGSRGGASQSNSAQLIIQPNAPDIVVHPVDQYAGNGSPARFSVVARGNEPLNYQWFHNSIAIVGASDAVLEISSDDTESAGWYYVSVENEFGLVFSDPAFLGFTSQDIIIDNSDASVTVTGDWIQSSLSDQFGADHFRKSVNSSGKVEFSAAIPRSGVYEIFEHLPFDGSNARLATYLIGNGDSAVTVTSDQRDVAAPDSWRLLGQFPFMKEEPVEITVSTLSSVNSGEVVADAFLLRRVSEHPYFVEHPASVSVPLGGTIELEAVVSGSNHLSYIWKHNGQLIPGANQAVLAIEQASFGDSGVYRLLVGSEDGWIESNPAILDVNFLVHSLRVEGDDLVIEWHGNWILQSSVKVTGPFEDIIAFGGSYRVPLDGQQRFFRLRTE